ncbi:hypothetical protein ACHAWC_004746 [Mediolabrus comicus]
MVTPNNSSSDIYRVPLPLGPPHRQTTVPPLRQNSTHRLLIEISFFLALITTFYQYHVISIHNLQQQQQQRGDNKAGGGNGSTEKKVDDVLNVVSKIGVGNAKFFCGDYKWKNTGISCDERVSYLITQYGGSLFDNREALLEQNCACNAFASATMNNVVNMTRTFVAASDAAETVQVQPSATLAPWDAAGAIGGSELIKDACQVEIEQSQCHGKLPLYNCLIGYNIRSNKTIEWFSAKCKRVVNRCSVEPSYYQISGMKFKCSNIIDVFQRSALNDIQARQLENLLQKIDDSFFKRNIQYWMAAGSTIGGVYHHSRIPWDDDVDMYVMKENLTSALDDLASIGLAVSSTGQGRTHKIYDPSLPSISSKYKHSYPFIDIFPIYCNKTTCVEKDRPIGEITYPRDLVFPLKRRPFGRNSLSFPNKLSDIVENRYGQGAKDHCVRPGYNHIKETFRGRKHHIDVRCNDLPLPPPLVVSTSSADEAPFQGRPLIRPWPSDLPDVTVEHLMDNNTRLSSVTFYNGNEIRRSYADGLMNANGKITENITFHVPTKTSHPTPLVPFLIEERESYARNVASRLAKDLNLEVMPMLDTPEVGNDFVTATTSDRLRLKIAEWNAERGTNWHVLPDFIPRADIIILNEMDWGMARSGNNHTIRSMANSLRMNYAYGVEFLELTNGNAAEINATVGMKNSAGYHGNAVLSKWRISDVSIVRLHPLYDLLYYERKEGMAKGERRLGGRMALFATTHIGGDTILLVSVHSHSGSKGRLFEEDAKLVCDEIQRRNATNVLLGGDTGPPFINPLVSDCGFYPLEKTNKKNGRRFQPTWRVDCPNGEAPRAKFQRGDWLLARGAGFSSLEETDDNTSLSVVYPYIMKDKKYECISDHAMLAMETDFVPGIQ